MERVEVEFESPNLGTKLGAYPKSEGVNIVDLTDTERRARVEDESCFFVHLTGYQQSIQSSWPIFARGA